MNTLTETIITWYVENKRDLPWRGTSDPYKIWLSEVILQQTRVNQGMNYYLRFVETFPGVKELSEAGEEAVLKLWQGLGYYSRARNLYSAACQVMQQYDGTFPATFSGLRKLKGVGDYTAAAIASIAFGEPVAVVDGNVARVLARLFNITEPVDTLKGKKILNELSLDLLDKKNPGISNQAFMEFGALQCKPAAPACNLCPLKEQCHALAGGSVDMLPVKSGKLPPKGLWLYYHVHMVEAESISGIILHHRKNKGLWKNLYDFPSIESDVPLDFDQIIRQFSEFAGSGSLDNESFSVSKEYVHKLTHRTVHAFFITSSGVRHIQNSGNVFMAHMDELGKYPLPRLIEAYLLDAKLI